MHSFMITVHAYALLLPELTKKVTVKKFLQADKEYKIHPFVMKMLRANKKLIL